MQRLDVGCHSIALFSFDLIRVLFGSLIWSEVFAVQSCDKFSNTHHPVFLLVVRMYLFKHNTSTRSYYLIDHTGKPTTWGKWAPAVVNFDRAFSDERGLQSLQMLAYIAAACVILSCSRLSLLDLCSIMDSLHTEFCFLCLCFLIFTRFATS